MVKGLQGGLKRTLDVMVGLVGLLFLAIPFLIVAVAIKLDSPGAVFFQQERAGKGGRSFAIHKFRTMYEGSRKGEVDWLMKDDPRITRVGRFLRSWGIDELPQLWNVLRGEMSLVGPRPTLQYQVRSYTERQRKRLAVKPGITGWSLIRGRNLLTWAERIEYDVWYVEHWSLWLDLWILLRTMWIVLIKREGVYGSGGINDVFGLGDFEEECK